MRRMYTKSGIVNVVKDKGIVSVSGEYSGNNWTNLTIDGVEKGLDSGEHYTAGDGIDITGSIISVDDTIATKDEIPTATSDLTNDSGFITIEDVPPDKIYNCTYGTTTYNDVTTALIGNKIPVVAYNNRLYIYTYKDSNNAYNFSAIIEHSHPTFIYYVGVNDQNTWWNGSSAIVTGNYEGNFWDSITIGTTHKGIPTKTSHITNDSGFINNSVTNLVNYTKTVDLAEVATSGDYDDLSNRPTIPTKTSDLTNDNDFVESNELSSVAFNGDYDDLINKPSIPTNTSDLINDNNFVESDDLASVAFTNDYNDLINRPTTTIVTLPNQYNRLTDLNTGIYYLSYAGPKYLYYSGTTSTSQWSVPTSSGPCILNVTKYPGISNNYWFGWLFCYNGSTQLLYRIITNNTSGSVYTLNLANILTSVPSTYKTVPSASYANYSYPIYSVQTIYGTNSSLTINNTIFAMPGTYNFCISNSSSTSYGSPYKPAGLRRAIIVTVGDTTYNSSYHYYGQQDFYVPEDGKWYRRSVNKINSTFTYGGWVDMSTGGSGGTQLYLHKLKDEASVSILEIVTDNSGQITWDGIGGYTINGNLISIPKYYDNSGTVFYNVQGQTLMMGPTSNYLYEICYMDHGAPTSVEIYSGLTDTVTTL